MKILGRLSAALAALALLLLAPSARATITFDAAAHAATGGTTGNSVSWTHTVSGSNAALFVSIDTGAGAGGEACTYNSVSMTSLGVESDSASAFEVAAFILAGPATGSHTVSCSVTNSGGILQGQSTSWDGVNQSTPNRTAQSNQDTGSAANITVVVSNAQSGDMVLDAVSGYNAAITAGASQTQRYKEDPVDSTALRMGHSSESASGSTTMTWTWSGTFFGSIGVALIPAAGGGGGCAPTLALMGVGRCG